MNLVRWLLTATLAMAGTAAAQPVSEWQADERETLDLITWIALAEQGHPDADVNCDNKINGADLNAMLAGADARPCDDDGDVDPPDGGGDDGDDGDVDPPPPPPSSETWWQEEIEAHGHDIQALLDSGEYTVVYVDLQGNNANDGSSPAQAVQTVAKARDILSRADGPVAMLLDAEDAGFNFRPVFGKYGWLSGPSRERPGIIASYPVAYDQRATIWPESPDGGSAMSMLREFENIVVANVTYRPREGRSFHNAAAVSIVAATKNITFQNIDIRGFKDGWVQDSSGPKGENTRILGSVISRNGGNAATHSGRSMGVYIAGVTDYIFAGNTIWKNGWNGVDRVTASQYSHNVYGQYSCDGTIVWYRNFFGDGAATGLMERAGSTVSWNVSWRDPIGIAVGTKEAIDPGRDTDGLAYARIHDNLVAESINMDDDDDGDARGWGINIGPVNQPSYVRDNIVTQFVSTQGRAYMLYPLHRSPGPVDVEVSGNINYGGRHFFQFGENMNEAGAGPVRIFDNRFDRTAQYNDNPGRTEIPGFPAGFTSEQRRYSDGNMSTVQVGDNNDNWTWPGGAPLMEDFYPNLMQELDAGGRGPDPIAVIGKYRERLAG